MKVLVLNNGEFTTQEITNSLEDLQKIVGGYIEVPFLSKTFGQNWIDIIINEEGKYINNLKPEIAIVDKKTGNILDLVMGNCVFAGHDDKGETIELNEEQTKIVKNELKHTALLNYKDKENPVRVMFI